MEQRILGRTERPVSVVGLGTWQLGADWGSVSETDALEVLAAAVEGGVTFFDTADVYGDGRSEQLIGRFLAENPGTPITVATKMGRREAQVPENYTLANFRGWVDRSRRNLRTDRLDLVQLHCPPASVLSSDQAYDDLDTLVEEGAIAAYGVSVETCDEALTAMSRRGTATVQIILNAFRRKPLDDVLGAAAANAVGIIARVPLASGLLSGRYTADTSSPPTTTAPTTGRGRPSTSARPSPGSTSRPGSRRPGSSPSWWPAPGSMRPRPRSRWRGSCSNPESPQSSPAPGPSSRLARTPPPESCRRWTPSSWPPSRRIYDRHLRAAIHDRW